MYRSGSGKALPLKKEKEPLAELAVSKLSAEGLALACRQYQESRKCGLTSLLLLLLVAQTRAAEDVPSRKVGEVERPVVPVLVLGVDVVRVRKDRVHRPRTGGRGGHRG